ncbi:helix-turn-helix domain-containing protein [Streptomyces sp. NPDC018584]|uniref:helix-turn-helix domain-containing protein n=1 Tax=unclassified Streptomyces TaxID=2593676 RepID=UPI00379ED125
MARRENPIPLCSRSLLALVTWLRNGRAATALTYEQLASRTKFSADTLARAASGRSVPQNPDVVLAYAEACGLSRKEAERLWKHARRDEARAQGVVSGHRSGVHISVVKDFADLHSALVDLHHDDGRPPLRSLDRRVGGLGRLPHSTVGRVLKGSSTPSRLFVAAFAEACNVRKSELPEWTKAWDRADADRRSSRLRSRKPSQRLVVHDRVTPRDLQLLMSEMESTSRRVPALKLTVRVPDPASPEADAAARMRRELLIDQAQRRGELACPQCRRPSFGYSTERGWSSQLCSSCAPSTPDEVSGIAADGDASALEQRRAQPGQPSGSAADTPTLVLRVPGIRPPLPQRRPSRAWPQASTPQPSPALNAETMTTLDEPLDTRDSIRDFFSPRTPPLPATSSRNSPPSVCPLGSECPEHGQKSAPTGNPDTPCPAARPLTPRIRINIPGSRPLPPVTVHLASEPAASRTKPSAPHGTPADTQALPHAQPPERRPQEDC